MNGGFLLKNQIKNYTSISASNTATNYDIVSVTNDVPGDCFLSSGNSVIIDIEFPESITFSGVSIVNHNLSQASTATISLSNTSFLEPTEIFTIHENWYSRLIEKKDDSGTLKEIFASNLWKNFPVKSAKYIRFEISSTDIIRIGTIFIPTHVFQFPRNYLWDFTRTFRVNRDIDNVNGQFYIDQKSEHEGFQITFPKIDHIYYEDFKRIFRPHPKVFIPFFDQPECYHGQILDELKAKVTINFKKSFNIDFWENAF